MTSVLMAGIIMGFVGSFHCVGMCGPLALSLPVSHLQGGVRYAGLLLYNSGRVVTYSLFGGLIGVFGKSLPLVGPQQWLSITGGVLILVYLFFSKSGLLKSENTSSFFFNFIRKKLGQLYQKKSFSNLFLIGILNGFLPCGFVYLAIAGAIAAGGVYESTLFMGGFGMGTIPAMLSVNLFGSLMGVSFSREVKKMYPYAMVLVASLLILRGLSLGIPYVSPKITQEKVHHCCQKK